MAIHDWSRFPLFIFHDFQLSWAVAVNYCLNYGLLPGDYYSLIESEDTKTSDPDVVFKRKRLVISHVPGHRVVAMIELVSPLNKSSASAIQSFVNKTVDTIAGGIHLLLVDLFPPTPRDPDGIHQLIWSQVNPADKFKLPPGKPLTLVAYNSGNVTAAYVTPVALACTLPEMLLFLTPDKCISVPLESAYQSAWQAVPRIWRDKLAPPSQENQR